MIRTGRRAFLAGVVGATAATSGCSADVLSSETPPEPNVLQILMVENDTDTEYQMHLEVNHDGETAWSDTVAVPADTDASEVYAPGKDLLSRPLEWTVDGALVGTDVSESFSLSVISGPKSSYEVIFSIQAGPDIHPLVDYTD
jgi:hypothetical protein